MSATLKGVLFDLDNTLLDRTRIFSDWARWSALNRLMAETDSDVEACVSFCVDVDGGGYTSRDVVFQRLKEWRPALTDEVDTLVAAFREQLAAQISGLDAGPARLLDALARADLPWGIVTNGSSSQLLKVRRLGIETRATCVVVSEVFGARKPDPAIFLAAAANLGVAPRDILFVGDNPEADILGAASVGMQTAWVRWGRDWPAEFARTPPDYTVDSLHELIHLIERDR